MSGLLRVAAPARARVLSGLSGLLAALPDPLHPLVEQVTGLEGEIALVARDGRGRAVAVSLAAEGEDLAALADLLAQCDWLRPRLRDWLKLNPALGVDPELGVHGLLLAPEFGPRTVALARTVGSEALSLGRVSAFEWEGALRLAVEPLALAPRASALRAAPPERSAAAASPSERSSAAREGTGDARAQHHLSLAELGPGVAALESRFRSGLHDDDLGLPRRPRSAPRG
jgi:hypothetical protein